MKGKINISSQILERNWSWWIQMNVKGENGKKCGQAAGLSLGFK